MKRRLLSAVIIAVMLLSCSMVGMADSTTLSSSEFSLQIEDINNILMTSDLSSTDSEAAESSAEGYTSATPSYVDIQSIGNGKIFVDEANLSRADAASPWYDYISYGQGQYANIAIDRAATTALADENGIIYAADGTPYNVPATQYKGITLIPNSTATKVDIEDGYYEKISIAAASSHYRSNSTTDPVLVKIYYTDETSETKYIKPVSGYVTNVDNFGVIAYRPKSYMVWDNDFTQPFAIITGANTFSFGSHAITVDPTKKVDYFNIRNDGVATDNSGAVTPIYYYVSSITLSEPSVYTTAHMADEIELADVADNTETIKKAYTAAEAAVENGWDSWDNLSHIKSLYGLIEYSTSTPSYVDIQSIGNGKIFVDEANLSRADAAEPYYDYISYSDGNYANIAVDRAATTALADEDGIIYAADGTPYKIPEDQYKGITLIPNSLATSVDIEDKNYEKISFAAASSHSRSRYAPDPVLVKIYYSDGTSETQYITPISGCSGAIRSYVETIAYAPKSYLVWGNNFTTEPFVFDESYPDFAFGSYTITVNPIKKVDRLAIRNDGVTDTGVAIYYYISSITLSEASGHTIAHMADEIALDDATANKEIVEIAYAAAETAVENGYDTWDNFSKLKALKNAIVYRATVPYYVDMESIGNSKIFIDETNLSRADATLYYDYISYGLDYFSTIAIDKSETVALADEDGIIYAEDSTPYKVPEDQYKGINLIKGEPAYVIDIEDKLYEEISFAAAASAAFTTNDVDPVKVIVYYSDGSSDTQYIKPTSGYNGADVDVLAYKPKSYLIWSNDMTESFVYNADAPSFSVGSYTINVDSSKVITKLSLENVAADATNENVIKYYYVTSITLLEASVYATAHSADSVSVENAIANKTLINAAYDAAEKAVENGWETWEDFSHLVTLYNELAKGYIASVQAIGSDNGDGTCSYTVIVSTEETEPIKGYIYIAAFNEGETRLLSNVAILQISAVVSDGFGFTDPITVPEGAVVKGFMYDDNLAPLGVVTIE